MRNFSKFCLGVAALAFTPPLSAEPVRLPVTASINVSPLRVDFGADQNAAELMVRNAGAQPLAVQIRLFAWQQDASGEHYVPSNDFTISPSIVQIDPDRTQTLRLIPTRPVLAGQQIAYRVVIDQLPGNVGAVQGAAQTRLRLTLPLFAGGDGAAPGAARFAVAGGRLTISNPGGQAIRLGSVALHQSAGTVAIEGREAPNYVLAGSAMSFAIPAGIACGKGPVEVTGTLDRQAYRQAATQTCP